MKARLAHLTGGRVGESTVIWKSCAMLGRSSQADVRFGPDGDRMVAGRHAALAWNDGVWTVRDLGSANGTFVDGSCVHGETALRDGSVIQLGRDGPQVRFSVIWEAGAPEPVRTVDVDAMDDPDAFRPVPHTPVILSRPDRDRPRVAPAHRHARAPAVALAVAVAVLGGITLARAGPSHAPDLLRKVLVAQADSVFAALDAIPGASPSMRSAVSETQSRVALMRGRLRRAPSDPVALTTLRDSLDLLAARARRLAGAAALDLGLVVRGSEPAIGLVEVRFGDGRRATVVAYAARGRDGRVRFVTSAPTLTDPTAAPTGLRLFLRGEAAGIPMRITARHPARGLSVLARETEGGSEAASGPPAAFPSPGEPVVLVHAVPAADRATFVDSRAALAAVVSVTRGEARLEQPGGHPAPGSAVFDQRGTLVGMVLPESAGFGVRAVPVGALLDPSDGRAGG
jgi:pSer/pThr/pTyr-binding forkhead associated (FHA) protein